MCRGRRSWLHRPAKPAARGGGKALPGGGDRPKRGARPAPPSGRAMAAGRPALARALLQQCLSARLQVKPPERGSEAEWVEVTSAAGRLPLPIAPSSRGGAGR